MIPPMSAQVQQLGLAPAAARWSAGFPADASEELVAKFARMLAVLGGEVMDSLKKVENGAFL